MMQIDPPKIELTFETLLIAVAVVLGVFSVMVAIVKGLEAWHKLSVRDRVKSLETRMDAAEKRLEKGNRRFKNQSDDMGQVLKTMQGLLVHFISGNDHELLKETSDELSEYMSIRTSREMEEK